MARGYAAGVCGGWLSGAGAPREVKHGKDNRTQVMAATVSEEDEKWCTDGKMVNVSAAKLKR